MRGHLRSLSLATLLAFVSAILPGRVLAFSAGEAMSWIRAFPKRFFRRLVPPKERIENPEELERVFAEAPNETFDGNGARRDEESSILRPVKQVGLAVLDGQIKIVKQFCSFQAAKLVTDFGRQALATGAIAKAGQVMSGMGAETAERLNRQLLESGFGRDLFRHLALGEGSKSFLLREGNFALMAFIAVFVSAGIYDGLDVDTFKDRIIAVSPYMSSHTTGLNFGGTLAQSFASRHIYAAFQGGFDRLYERAIASRSTWGAALRRMDAGTAAMGERLFRSARQGGAAEGTSLATRMGLVGVGEGTALSLKGLAGRAAIGTGFALVGELGVDASVALARGMPDRVMLGADRNRLYVQQDTNWWQFQRTGKGLQDWWEQRRILLRELVHQRLKLPVTHLTYPLTAMLGGYAGSVVAGMLFAGGGLVPIVGGTLVSSLFAGVGAWIGRWAATKIDRGTFMMDRRREGYVRRLRREIREMPRVVEEAWDEDRIDEIARARALDFEKLEKAGQVGARLLVVDDFANVRLGRKGGYVYMVIDEEHGSRHFEKADNRFDVIDLEGNRLVFDLHRDALRPVGRVAENSGRKICFVDGRPAVEEDHLVNGEDGELHLFANGLILERRDEEWIVRGQGAADDVFFRDTEERFAWDPESRVFRRAAGPEGRTERGSEPTGSTTDPLAPYAELFANGVNPAVAERVLARSTGLVESCRRGLFEEIDGLRGDADLADFLRTARQRIGLADPLGIESSEEDFETRRMHLKGRIDGLVDRLGRRLGTAFRETLPEGIEAGWRLVHDLHPMTPGTPPFQILEGRLAQAPIWGPLGILSQRDALLVFALLEG